MFIADVVETITSTADSVEISACVEFAKRGHDGLTVVMTAARQGKGHRRNTFIEKDIFAYSDADTVATCGKSRVGDNSLSALSLPRYAIVSNCSGDRRRL